MSKILENQIQFVCEQTKANVSFYISFKAEHGRWPNYFWITPDKKLAIVFIELDPEYKRKRCYSKICGGKKGATFDPAQTTVSYNNITEKYQEGKIVHFDESTQKFVFEELDVPRMINCTKIYYKKINVGLKNFKDENAEIINVKESPAYVPFTAHGLLIPNAFFFGEWGCGNFGVYQFYYLFNVEKKCFNMKIVPFISRTECKELNMADYNMIIQVPIKHRGSEDTFYERSFRRGTQVEVDFYLNGDKQFDFFVQSIKDGDFKNDADYVAQCKKDRITFMLKKL